MKDRIARAKKFIKNHKTAVLLGTGVAIGAVAGSSRSHTKAIAKAELGMTPAAAAAMRNPTTGESRLYIQMNNGRVGSMEWTKVPSDEQ